MTVSQDTALGTTYRWPPGVRNIHACNHRPPRRPGPHLQHGRIVRPLAAPGGRVLCAAGGGDGPTPDTFRGQHAVQGAGPDVHRGGHAPRPTRSTARRPCIARSDQRYFKLNLQLEGTGLLIQDNREAVLRPGDLAIYDTNRPYTLAFEEQARMMVVMFPHDALSLPPGLRGPACGGAAWPAAAA